MVPAQSEWSKLKAVVIYAHGFVYHSAGNDFTVQSKNMLANNVAIFYMDHIGHGYSEGEIGRLPMYQNMIDDYEDFTALIMTGKSPMGEFEFDGIPEGYLEACRKLPYFTMGHSMGGAIVCMASRRFHGRPGYKGMILLAPALWIDLPPYCVQQFCRYTVAKWFPSTSVPLWLSNHLQFPKAWRPEWLETVAKDREPPNGLCYKVS
jgi:alpha-beta hydrolase superfamily lysophospholipase